MAEISVIVPIYNVEKYLRKCIESILGQTFHNIEIILVDDGSTDKSGRICDEYADKDARVVVIHKANGGPSDARNQGIQRSSGEYITYIDSDDYIDRRYLEILYRVIQEKGADLVLCNNTSVMGEDIPEIKKFDYQKIVSDAVILSKAEAYDLMLLDRETSITAWGKLYHRRLFQSVRYPKGELYEDLKVIDQIVESSQKIVYIPYDGYFYLVRRGSITHGKITPAHMTSVSNAGHLLKLMRDKYPEAEKSAKINYTLQCFRMFSALVDRPEYIEKCRWLRKEILKEGREFFVGSYSDFESKCSLICLGIGIPFYKIMRKFYYMIIVQ